MSSHRNDIINDEFTAAVNIIQNLPKEGPISIDITKKLQLYSLFKIVTVGDNTTEKPSIWHVFERTKWYYWKEKTGLDKNLAKKEYVGELKNILRDFFLKNKDCLYDEKKLDNLIKTFDVENLCNSISKTDILIILKGIENDEHLNQKEKEKIIFLYKKFFNL